MWNRCQTIDPGDVLGHDERNIDSTTHKLQQRRSGEPILPSVELLICRGITTSELIKLRVEVVQSGWSGEFCEDGIPIADRNEFQPLMLVICGVFVDASGFMA
jgi:hypothetical protein